MIARAAKYMGIALIAGGAALVSGAPADITRGLAWLGAQVQADGQLLGDSKAATQQQARCETATALLKLTGNSGPVAALVASMQEAPADAPTETLACTQELRQKLGQTILASELERRRVDQQGYGAYDGIGAANALDTGWALAAQLKSLAAADKDKALAWLQASQAADGSFAAGGAPSLIGTAVVLRALKSEASANATAAGITAKAAAYLLAQRSAQTQWQDDTALTALVYEAVHPYTAGDATLAAGVESFLLARQQAEGSWQGDTYVTALALRALALAGEPPLDPTKAGLKVRFADARTAAFLPGVILTGTGTAALSAASDAGGLVELRGLAVGAYQLKAGLAGYATVSFSIAPKAGEVLNLGVVQMLVAGSPTVAVISGTVRAQDTNEPLAGATVSVEGQALSATTGVDGSYLISNVPPASVVVNAAKGGYASAAAQLTAVAGQVLNFSPVLVPASGTSTVAECKIQGQIVDGITQAPLAGVAVAVSGAVTQATGTDAQGRFTLANLASGVVQVQASKSGYDTVRVNTRLVCVAGRASVVDFSPRMFPGNQSPPNANTAGMTGVVMDARTNAPIANAQLTVTPDSGVAKTTLTVADGSFGFAGLDGATAQLRVQATGYEGLTVQYSLTPLRTLDVAQIRLRPPKLEQILPDFKMIAVRRHTAVTNAQSLQLAGVVQVVLVNAGTQSSPAGVPLVAFSDTNGNGKYDAGVDLVLGSASVAASLVPAQTATLEIAVAGVLPFRDAPIHVMADPDNQFAELSETNNLRSTSQEALAPVVTKPFTPKLKWQWAGSSVEYYMTQVMMTPVVGALYDTNGDGKVDQNDVPNVVFTSFYSYNYEYSGVIRVVDGRDGREIRTISNPGDGIAAVGALALADLDGDGKPEIIAVTPNHKVVAFRPDGTKLWSSVQLYNASGVWGGVSVADLDGDGSPEIIFGHSVLNANGTEKWRGTVAVPAPAYRFSQPIAADLFGTGQQNVLTGGFVYTPTGQLLWGTVAFSMGVADFEGNGIPSVVTDASSFLSRYTREGVLLWRVAVPGNGGGPITIADVDNDGIPEIGVAGGSRYSVFRADGSLLWSQNSQDASSQITGSTFFDFDGDGANEAVYADETSLRVFDGATGSVKWSLANPSATAIENPVVVDVDRDGHADIVVAANNFYICCTTGVRVFQDVDNAWVPTRSVWNQHAYSINNINDDLSVPRNPAPSWQTHNTFRLNQRVDASGRAVADLTVGYARVADGGAGASTVTVRVGNAGSYKVPAGTKVAFYSSNPATATPTASQRLGTASLAVDLQPGQRQDVSLSLATIAGLPAVWIVGDDDGTGKSTVADYDRANNTHMADLSAIAVNLKVAVAASKASYTEQEQAVFTSSVTNAGSFARTAQVRVSVLDKAGQVVQLLPLGAVLDVAAGAVMPQAASWPVSGVLSGNYTVLSELVTPQGLVYGSATAGFVVSASQATLNTARLTTDRVSYTAAQAVQLTARVANQSANVVQENLQARTVVSNASGVAVFNQVEAIAQLAAGGQRQYGYSLAAAGLAAGSYTAQLQLLAGTSVLAQSSASFTVVGSDQSGIGLAGVLQAAPSVALVGQPVALNLAAGYSGNAVLANVPVTVRVLEPASGTVIASYTSVVSSWAPGTSQSFAYSWTSQGLDGQVLVAAATAQVNGRDIAVGQATIRLQGVAQLEATPLQLTFTPIRVGESATQAVVLRSVGSLAVTSLTLSLGGADASQFVLPSGGCLQTSTLPVGATCTATVSYRPNAAGDHAGLLDIGYAGSVGLGVTLTAKATPAGLRGIVWADPTRVGGGDTLTVGYDLTNPGPDALTVTYSLVVYDAAGIVRQNWPVSGVIASGATLSGSHPYTAPLQAQTLTVALKKPGTAPGDDFATATFIVTEPSVSVGVAAQVKRDARILMLASCTAQAAQHTDGHAERKEPAVFDPNDSDAEREQRAQACEPQPDEPGCMTARVQGVDALLKDLGLVHKIVTNQQAFRHELRCGGYNTYWISGGAAKLSPTLAKEVREAVWRGDSLIVDGEHDDRNFLLDPVLGVWYRGKIGGSNLTMNIAPGTMFPAGSVATMGQPPRLDAAGAQRQARFTGSYAQDAAILSNTYGQGRSLAFAFDLAGMVGAQPKAAEQPGQLVQAAASHLANGTASLAVGDIAALALTVSNPGAAPMAVRVVGTLPAGLGHVGAAPEVASVGEGTVSWNLTLGAGASQEIVWRLRAVQGGTQMVKAAVYSLPAGTGTAVLQASTDVQLAVAVPSDVLSAVMPALQAIETVTPADNTAKRKAIGAAEQALAAHGKAAYTEAIEQWTASASALITIAGADTHAARDAVARAMEASSAALCEQMTCLIGSTSLSPMAAPAGTRINVYRKTVNMCTAAASGVDLDLDVTWLATGQNVMHEQARGLVLQPREAVNGQGNWLLEGQIGEWFESLLTATWQGHQFPLGDTRLQIVAPKRLANRK